MYRPPPVTDRASRVVQKYLFASNRVNLDKEYVLNMQWMNHLHVDIDEALTHEQNQRHLANSTTHKIMKHLEKAA
jgi:hypothetical protein